VHEVIMQDICQFRILLWYWNRWQHWLDRQ